ncbi:MAG: hypothetical protein WAL90_19095 [Desulfobacterales bacterium]
MVKRLLATLLTTSLLLLAAPGGHGFESRDILRLKQAGIADETLRVLIREKSVETGAFTIDEILALKKAGVADATLRMLIAEQSFLKDRQPVIYGRLLHPLRFTSIQDVIQLKEAGLSDAVIVAILNVLREENPQARQKAWDMLNSMGILVDQRGDR